VGEDLDAWRRELPVGDRHLSKEAVEALFRGIWKFIFVLFVTLAVLFAVGWVIQALTDGEDGSVATTVDER
jgi:hypothetical protein